MDGQLFETPTTVQRNIQPLHNEHDLMNFPQDPIFVYCIYFNLNKLIIPSIYRLIYRVTHRVTDFLTNLPFSDDHGRSNRLANGHGFGRSLLPKNGNGT